MSDFENKGRRKTAETHTVNKHIEEEKLELLPSTVFKPFTLRDERSLENYSAFLFIVKAKRWNDGNL